MGKNTKLKQENTIATERLQKEYLYFCTWSTTDRAPCPVTHHTDPDQWQLHARNIFLEAK